jgi:parvulin-like peptidyl-prolyl isomerase
MLHPKALVPTFLLLCAATAGWANEPAPAPQKSQALVGEVKLAPAAPDAPVIKDGPITVDTADVLAYLQRIPDDKRANFRLSYDRMADVADAVFVSRSLAERAHEAGLDKDDETRRLLRQAQDEILAQLYLTKVRAEVDKLNLDQRAREIYMLDPKKYVHPEYVRLQYILVSYVGRTREAARERAQEVVAKARKGEDFLQLAAQYSDDPGLKQNGGEIGLIESKVMDPDSRAAVDKLQKGQVSDPVQAEHGIRIFRLVERDAARQLTFDEAKGDIIEAERERLRKEKTDEILRQIRSSPTVVTNVANLESLVIPIDEKTTQRLKELQDKFAREKEAKEKAAREGAAKPSQEKPAQAQK